MADCLDTFVGDQKRKHDFVVFWVVGTEDSFELFSWLKAWVFGFLFMASSGQIVADIFGAEESLAFLEPFIDTFCSDLSDDLISEIFFVSNFILNELKRLELLKILEFFELDGFLDHILQGGDFLEAVDDIHKIVPQVYKLFLEHKPLLI